MTDVFITTLKGAQYKVPRLQLECTTIGQLKVMVSAACGQAANTIMLTYRAKPLSDESKTIKGYGAEASNLKGKFGVHLHLAARFNGGARRSAVNEVAVQLKYVVRGKLSGVVMVEPEDELTWNMLLRGPAGSPFEGAIFSLTYKFPPNYPEGAPEIKFNTPIFHPNVFASGKLCWNEQDTSGSIYYADILIGAVNALLAKPNPDSPANGDAAQLYRSNPAEYNRRAKRYCEQHAMQG